MKIGEFINFAEMRGGICNMDHWHRGLGAPRNHLQMQNMDSDAFIAVGKHHDRPFAICGSEFCS